MTDPSTSDPSTSDPSASEPSRSDSGARPATARPPTVRADPAASLLPADDVTTPEAWEQVRRSIAMLPPGTWAMRREQSLQALGALIGALRHRR